MIYSELPLLTRSFNTLLQKLASCCSGNIHRQSQQHQRKKKE